MSEYSEPNSVCLNAMLASHVGMLSMAESPALLNSQPGGGSREGKGFLEEKRFQEKVQQAKGSQIQLHLNDLHLKSNSNNYLFKEEQVNENWLEGTRNVPLDTGACPLKEIGRKWQLSF